MFATGFSWSGEVGSEFPLDMNFANNFAKTYRKLKDGHRAAFNAYIKEAISCGKPVPDVAKFEKCYMGEYTNFVDFAIGYANDVILGNRDYDSITRYFDYKAYARDTGLGEEEANEYIRVANYNDIKRYFDYIALVWCMEDSYIIVWSPGGNVFVFDALIWE